MAGSLFRAGFALPFYRILFFGDDTFCFLITLVQYLVNGFVKQFKCFWTICDASNSRLWEAAYQPQKGISMLEDFQSELSKGVFLKSRFAQEKSINHREHGVHRVFYGFSQ